MRTLLELLNDMEKALPWMKKHVLGLLDIRFGAILVMMTPLSDNIMGADKAAFFGQHEAEMYPVAEGGLRWLIWKSMLTTSGAQHERKRRCAAYRRKTVASRFASPNLADSSMKKGVCCCSS